MVTLFVFSLLFVLKVCSGARSEGLRDDYVFTSRTAEEHQEQTEQERKMNPEVTVKEINTKGYTENLTYRDAPIPVGCQDCRENERP